MSKCVSECDEEIHRVTWAYLSCRWHLIVDGPIMEKAKHHLHLHLQTALRLHLHAHLHLLWHLQTALLLHLRPRLHLHVHLLTTLHLLLHLRPHLHLHLQTAVPLQMFPSLILKLYLYLHLPLRGLDGFAAVDFRTLGPRSVELLCKAMRQCKVCGANSKDGSGARGMGTGERGTACKTRSACCSMDLESLAWLQGVGRDREAQAWNDVVCVAFRVVCCFFDVVAGCQALCCWYVHAW